MGSSIITQVSTKRAVVKPTGQSKHTCRCYEAGHLETRALDASCNVTSSQLKLAAEIDSAVNGKVSVSLAS